MDLTPAHLRSRGGLKWTYHPADVLAAWVAEMDYGLAPPVADALRRAVERGDTGYFYTGVERATAEAATSFWEDRFGWRVEPERVVPVPDVVEGIRRAIIHLTRPGSPVVLHTPVYHPFFSMVERAGRELVEVPCHPDGEGRYSLDLDGIDGALASGAGSVVVCSPWNPTGTVFSSTELSDLVDLARRHSARIIADEVHAPLLRRGTRHTPVASLDPVTVVTVTSASKAWNVPGLKAAQVVLTADADLEKWVAYYSPDKVGVGTFGLIANAAAYADGRAWLDEVLGRLDDNQRLLGELLARHLPTVGYFPPAGTYLAWLDFRRHGLDDPAAHLLQRARVALTGGGPFGAGGVGHARLNFATPPGVLIGIVERMAAALGDRR